MNRRAVLLGFALFALVLAASPPARAAGPTYVRGEVFGVWDLEGSPYVLVGDANVPFGLSLDIQAGVEVRVDAGFGLEVGGDLHVLGTVDEPVRLTANGTGAPGYWQGITLVQPLESSIAHAVVEYAATGLSVSGGSLTVTGSSFTHGFAGLAAQDASVTLVEPSLSNNVERGLLAENAEVTVLGGLFQNDGTGATLAATNAYLEGTTILGTPNGDLVLGGSSFARLRTVHRQGDLQFLDAGSRAIVEGVLSVTVEDKYATPKEGAAVVIEDAPRTNRTEAATGPEGRTPDVVVTEQYASMAGVTDFNPFHVTATLAGRQAATDVTVAGRTELTVTIPADVTPPKIAIEQVVSADEDVPVTLDASATTDDDPAFAATGTFRWTFPDLGLELHGITATHTFETPGLAQGVLTAADASGNEASLSLAVRVRDHTPPTIVSILVPDGGTVGEVLTLEAQAADNDPTFPTGAQFLWRFTLGNRVIERGGPRVLVAFDREGVWGLSLTVRDADGNEATTQDTIGILPPSTPPNPLPWIGLGAALLAAALGLSSERGKAGLFLFFLPLYSRLRDDDVLDQFTRGQIYGYVRVHPGDTYTDIKLNLRLNNGTLTYHLDVLEKQGLVRSQAAGARKRFYPADIRLPENGGGLHELQMRLLKGLSEAPGIAVVDLAESLGISRQLALYHLRLLVQRGYVRLERQGLRLCGYSLVSSATDAQNL